MSRVPFLQQQQVNAQDALQGLLECLLWCCQPHAQEAEPAATSPVVQHLLLEALPTHDAAALSQPQLKAFAVQLMLIYCANISSCKMAAKVGVGERRVLCLSSTYASGGKQTYTCNPTHFGRLLLVLQVASTFRLGPDDLDAEGWQQLSASVPVMLQQPSSYKAAVNLMMQFEVRGGRERETQMIESFHSALSLCFCSTRHTHQCGLSGKSTHSMRPLRH